MDVVRDALKQVIRIGDKVTFNPPHVKGLSIGNVLKMNPKTVTIRYYDWFSVNGKRVEQSCTRRTAEIVRITEQMQIAKDENPEEYL